MTDILDFSKPPSATPVAHDEPCPCGSGLKLKRCCGLKLNQTPRTPPEGLFADRIAAMSRAYNDGEGELARHIALEVLDQAPGQKEALGALYNVCKDDRKMAAAEALAVRLARLYPNDPTTQVVAAQFLLGKGDAAAAQPYARMLVRLAPMAAASHVLMGRVFNGLNHPRAAEHHFRRAMALDEAFDPAVEGGLGAALKGQGRVAEAREVLDRALARGENLDILLALAALEEADRDFEAAGAALDRAAAVAPSGPRVALARANLHRQTGALEQALEGMDGLETRLDQFGLSASCLLEKGQVLDALGRYDEAFDAFTAAKQKVRDSGKIAYADAYARDLVDRLKGFFTPGRSEIMPRATVRTNTPQPIFIVGFPRSGTTLVEQTLASHPNINAGDELQVVSSLCERMQALLGSPGAYPTALSELWLGDRIGQIETLRDYYLNEATRVGAVDPAKAWFTDKMPLNETHLGLIHLLFPASPVIHLVRHPLDVVLSVFSNGMTHGFHCASALETAARHYALIADLIVHYHEILPIRYKAIRYEDLVTDQEAQVRGLFDFIGEPFDARTLDFHENTRRARTASYAQVTRKLYTGSRYRYRNYLRHLEPVIPILEPSISRLGYTIER